MVNLASQLAGAMLALAALVALVFVTPALVTPAQAQVTFMAAGGSCGYQPGEYGLTDVNSRWTHDAGESVPALYFRIEYAGVPAPTTVGVIVRYNGELESQTALQTFTAETPGGTFESALNAAVSPDAQGFANSLNQARRGAADGPTDANRSTRPQNSPSQGSLMPGDYVFYVYTGAMMDTPEGRKFVADERGYLGTFSCGVSTEQGSGPG
ncbi:MAG: hypothetical protein IT305_05510 [Chloroflexi bacterium]|nr:hypothetical protein [Chloroflexota bacterium]